MTTLPAPSTPSSQWLPAERLGQMSVEGNVRPWLIGHGSLSQRLKSVCGPRFAPRFAGQWSGTPTDSQKSGLRAADNDGLFREIEMCCDEVVWVFAQTVIPDSTLSLHSWLAELGDTPLEETLEVLSGVERSPYEYARLPAEDRLAARVLRDAEIKPAALWARRRRVALREAPLLVQEVFLPIVGSI